MRYCNNVKENELNLYVVQTVSDYLKQTCTHLKMRLLKKKRKPVKLSFGAYLINLLFKKNSINPIHKVDLAILFFLNNYNIYYYLSAYQCY